MRAFSVVLERDAFDAVRAEQSQLADVLLELFVIPAIVRVRGLPVAKLMAADWQDGSGRDIQIGRDARRAPGPLQRPQKLADAKQRAARISALNPDDCA